VKKNTKNEFAIIDVARLGRFTVPRAVTITSREFDNSAAGADRGSVTYNIMDLPDSPTPNNVIMNIPDGSYKYDTLQFAFNKRFGSGLFIQTSYDYQWRDELRGGTFATTGTISPNTSPLNSDSLPVGFFQNVNPSVSNRQKNTNWQGRLIGRYVFKYNIGVAANLRVQSGFAYARVIALSNAQLPNAGSTRFYADNIENNRSDTVPILDLRADKAFRIGKYKFTGMFDVYNLTDSNAVSNFTMTNGNTYNKIIATLDPRVAQVGIRFDF